MNEGIVLIAQSYHLILLTLFASLFLVFFLFHCHCIQILLNFLFELMFSEELLFRFFLFFLSHRFFFLLSRHIVNYFLGKKNFLKIFV